MVQHSLAGILLALCMFELNQSAVMGDQWVSDGSTQISSVDNQVICSTSGEVGNVYNALWEEGSDGLTSGQHYWQLEVGDLGRSSIFVGITDKHRFKQGYAIKALFYGGNLADGSRLLVGKFGPRIKSGDVVGIFVSFEQGNIKVYFDVNGNSLGLAYDLPSSKFKGIYPVVQFDGEGSLKITKTGGQPRSLARPTKIGLEDDWEAEEFKVDGNVKKIPGKRTITLSIGKKDEVGKYSVAFQVGNIIGSTLESENGKWTVDQAIWSTEMGVPKNLQKFEGYAHQLLANPTRIELIENGSYLIWENSGENLYSKWKRSQGGPQPVTKAPF